MIQKWTNPTRANNNNNGTKTIPKWQRYTCIALVSTLIICCDDLSLTPFLEKTIMRNSYARRLEEQLQQKRAVALEAVRNLVLKPRQQSQVSNYVRGKGLMYNIHVTHHGGTTFCGVIGKPNGRAPSFACQGPSQEEQKNGTMTTWPPDLDVRDWYYKVDDQVNDEINTNDTSSDVKKKNTMSTRQIVDQFRKHDIHMVSTEFQCYGPLDFDWKDDNLLSVVIMRHPIDRFLAGGKCGKAGREITTIEGEIRKYEMLNGKEAAEQNASSLFPISPELWWEYANDDCADNCALRVLSNDYKHCCHGAETNRRHLERAKQQLEQFTFVLDLSCLDESMLALGHVLNLTSVDIRSHQSLKGVHPTARERIANDTLYEYLTDKFRLDIELYEWSKQLSLVKC